jgi:hypothetical protein
MTGTKVCEISVDRFIQSIAAQGESHRRTVFEKFGKKIASLGQQDGENFTILVQLTEIF